MYNKKKRIIIILMVILVLVVIAVTFSFATDEEPVVITDEVMSLYNELNGTSYKVLNSEKYLVADNYISRILPDTKIDNLKEEFNIDKDNIKIFNGEEEVTTGIVETGMILKENNNTYTLIVIGDVSKDGKLDKVDLTKIINNTKTTELDELTKKSSDINEDNVVDKIDVDSAIKYIFNEGLEVKAVENISEPTIDVIEGDETDGWYKENVKLKVSNTNENVVKTVYLIKGTKERLETIVSDTEIEVSGYGAYKVVAYSYGKDGNRSNPVELIVGVDTDNKCIKYGINTLSECMIVNDGDYNNVESAIADIGTKSASFTKLSTKDEGLFKTEDDLGESYYYRGAVADNYVEFAGYTWRIIRRNGDGSVRMIFNGNSTSSTGSDVTIGDSVYNPRRQDAAFVGYMYGLEQAYRVTNATNTYNQIKDVAYYYSDDIECSEETKKCSLTGNILSGIWTEVYDQVLNGNEENGNVPYKYTCWGKKETTTCDIASMIVDVVETNGEINPEEAKVKYLGYISVSRAAALKDDINSTIKEKIDEWYENNILNVKDEFGNNYEMYIADQYFCNDRTVSQGSSYNLEVTTYFKGNSRKTLKNPSIVCGTEKNKFTVSPENGNGELKYPIGLITSDEIFIAGALNGYVNDEFWLWTGDSYWTMTPAYFHARSASASVLLLDEEGAIITQWMTIKHGVRPVINISSDVLVTGGNGTADNPYKIGLNK